MKRRIKTVENELYEIPIRGMTILVGIEREIRKGFDVEGTVKKGQSSYGQS